MNNYQQIAGKLFKKALEDLTAAEKRVLQHVTDRVPISRNIHANTGEKLSFGQRLADRVASFGGSWPFIIIFVVFLLSWISLNVAILLSHHKPFDPYPFILLNLFLSMLAAIQAPVIMMSQNRQSAHDRLDAEHDYEVNLKAELEIITLHEKLDDLRDQQWKHLMAVQQEQMDKLNELEKMLSNKTGV